MAHRPQSKPQSVFFSKLDRTPRGTFEMSAADMYATFPREVQENLVRGYAVGRIRDVSAYVCAQWVQRQKAQIAVVRADHEKEAKKAQLALDQARRAEEREETRKRFEETMSSGYTAAFPQLCAPSCIPPRGAAPAWAREEVRGEEQPQDESGARGAAAATSAALWARLGPLVEKRVEAAWYGAVHVGVVKRVDAEACTVQIFWEEEYSQSDVNLDDIVSILGPEKTTAREEGGGEHDPA